MSRVGRFHFGGVGFSWPSSTLPCSSSLSGSIQQATNEDMGWLICLCVWNAAIYSLWCWSYFPLELLQELFVFRVYVSIRIPPTPQTDGQSEAVNRYREVYLRWLGGDAPSRWCKWIPWVSFCYNTTFHSSLHMSPYQTLYGKPPPTNIGIFSMNCRGRRGGSVTARSRRLSTGDQVSSSTSSG